MSLFNGWGLEWNVKTLFIFLFPTVQVVKVDKIQILWLLWNKRSNRFNIGVCDRFNCSHVLTCLNEQSRKAHLCRFLQYFIQNSWSGMFTGWQQHSEKWLYRENTTKCSYCDWQCTSKLLQWSSGQRVEKYAIIKKKKIKWTLSTWHKEHESYRLERKHLLS